MANRFLNNIRINDSYTLPSADGSVNQVITTDGAGNLSFIDVNSVIDTATGEVYYTVKNSTGSTLSKGKAVMAVGSDGNSGHILVDEMIADGSIEPKYFLGVLAEDIGNGNTGKAIHFGQIDQFDTRGQNGETWNDGDILWCDPDSDGDFTITEPDGPNVKIAAAIVLNAATNGKIQVRVQANEGIHDLHDTKIVNQVDGDILVWDNTTGVWFNDSTLNVDQGVGVDITGNLDVSGVLRTDEVRTLSAQQLVLNAGESHAYATGQTGEYVYINAEKGLFIASSPDNWATAWANRTTGVMGTLGNSDGKLRLGSNSADNILLIRGGSTKAEITSTGIDVTGDLTVSNSTVAQLYLDSATGNDSAIYHRENSVQVAKTGYDTSEDVWAVVAGGGAFSTAQLKVDTNGVDITGNLDVSGSGTFGDDITIPNNTSVIAPNSTGSETSQLIGTTGSNGLVIGQNARWASTGIYSGGLGYTLEMDSSKNSTFNGNLDVSGDVTAQGDTVTLLNENSGNKNINIRKRFDGSSYINWIRSSNTDAYIGVDETENLQIGYASSGLNRDLIFTSNNSEVIRFDRQGNVGIGTTSPSQKLHLKNNGDVAIALENQADTSGNYWKLWQDNWNGTSNFTFNINYGGTDFLTVNTSGNVGIGTTSPSEKLEVAGNVRLSTTGDKLQFANNNVGIYRELSNILTLGGYGGIHFNAEGVSGIQNQSTRMVISDSGNVGIGTTSFSGKLSVHEGGSGVYFTRHSGDNGTVGPVLGFANDSTKSIIAAAGDGIIFRTRTVGGSAFSGSEKMRITSGGLVGIGTTSPSATLHISDAANSSTTTFSANGRITMSGDGVFNWGSSAQFGQLSWDTNKAIVRAQPGTALHLGAAGNANHMVIDTSGNVGIGETNPSGKLHIAPNGYSNYVFTGNSTSGYTTTFHMDNTGLDIGHNSTGRALNLKTGSLDRLTILGNGNVGIGITSPLHPLSIESASSPLIKIRNTTNGGGAGIEFNDNGASAANQNGRIVYKHSDGASQGGGSTFEFTGEDDQTLQVLNNGRIVVQKSGSATEVGYGFYNDVDTGMYRADANTLAFSTAGNNRLHIDSSGNVGIGETNPEAKLDVSGAIKSSHAVYNDINGIRLINPGGGSSNSLGNSNTVGAIKIALPQSWTSTMMRMTIKVYEYSESKSFTINCGGYNHTSSSAWINEFAYIESQSEIDRNFTVRFGYDSNNKCCIYIGELDSVWQYPKVFVTDFQAGFNNTQGDKWDDGWSVSMETSAFENISQTRTNCQVNNWKRNGSDLYYGSASGSVGIGTTSNSAGDTSNGVPKLQVNTSTAVLGEFPLAARFTTGVDAGDNSGVSVLINSGNDRGLMISAGRQVGNVSKVTLNVVKNDGVEIDTMTFLQNGSGGSTANVGIGTTSPTYKLHVAGKSASSDGFHKTGSQGVILSAGSGADTAVISNGWTSGVGDWMRLEVPSADDEGGFIQLNSNRRVGIGTTNPEAIFEVHTIDSNRNVRFKAPNGEQRFQFYTGGTGNSSYLRMYDSTGSTVGVQIHAAGTSYLNGGNVGIGTVSPSEKLDVVGNIELSGNVIDASSAAYYLDLNGTSQLNHGYFFSSLSFGGFSAGTRGTQLEGYSTHSVVRTDSERLDFYMGKTTTGVGTMMSLTDTGKVGIGTTSPGEKLDVSGIGQFAGAIKITEGGTAQSILIGNQDSGGLNKPSMIMGVNGALRFGWGDSWTGEGGSFTETLQLKNNGDAYFTNNVGIGETNPQTKLHVANGTLRTWTPVSGTTAIFESTQSNRSFITITGAQESELWFGNATTQNKGRVRYENTNNMMEFWTNASPRMYIDSAGDVGIGAASPSYKLDVSGTIRATGDVIAFSDERVKENIHTIENALDKVNKLRGVEYNKIGEEKQSIGVIAQEVEKILPQAVYEDEEGMKSVAYGNMVGVLIEAIKEQNKIIENLKKTIDGITK